MTSASDKPNSRSSLAPEEAVEDEEGRDEEEEEGLEGDSIVLGSAEARPPNASLLCRSCLRCRAKKIKCSGKQPSCDTCAARGLSCCYRQDARRRSGNVRGHVHTLQKEVLYLRQLIRDGNTSSMTVTPPQTNEMDVESEASHSNLVEVPSSHQLLPQQTSGISPGMAIGDAPVNGPSPIEAQVVGAFREDGHIKVHGVTSALHQGFAKADEPTDLDMDTARQRLISYAAIQRQHEPLLFSINTNLDLDGVAPSLAKHLLDIHWNRQHFTHLLTHRPAVIDSLCSGGPYINKLLLNAIFFTSCQYSDRESLRPEADSLHFAGQAFYNRVKALLVEEFDRPTIPTAIALLLCGQCLVAYGKQSAGWVMCGAAYRMIVDLGCHLSVNDKRVKELVEPVESLAVESEIRKRLYWGAFIIDKLQSLYLGRPPALRASEARVSKELLDRYEELESWVPYLDPDVATLDNSSIGFAPRPSYAVSTFQVSISIAEICSNVIECFYTMESTKIPIEQAWERRSVLLHELRTWKGNMPPHLCYEPDEGGCSPPPHQFNPHAIYWTLVVLVGRPFWGNGHLKALVDPSSQVAIQEECTQSALKIWALVKAFKNTFSLRRAPYLLCYAAYNAILVLLHSREAQVNFPECVPYLWSSLVDLKRKCHTGFKKPLQTLRDVIGPGIEGDALSTLPDAIGTAIDDLSQDPGQNPRDIASVGPEFGNINFLETGLDAGAWNTPYWLDRVVGDILQQQDATFSHIFDDATTNLTL